MVVVLLGGGLNLREISARAQTAAASAQETTEATSTTQAQSPAKEQQEQDPDDVYRMSPNVVAFGAKLGMNAEQSSTAFTIANFLLLAIGIGWFAAKLLPKMLRDRTTTIQKNLSDARTATDEARARLSGVEERLGKLDGDIAAMRAHAEQDAVAAEQRIKSVVEDEKKKILAAAEQEIASASNHAQKQLQRYAAELAIEQAAHRLVVSAETDRLLVQGFARQLTGDESKKGQN